MTPIKTQLFIHGGPGLNSFAEKAMLSTLLDKNDLPTEFWNEPSLLRRDGVAFDSKRGFSGWMKSLRDQASEIAKGTNGKVGLIAHSFGANAAFLLAKELPFVSSLVLINPAFHLMQTHKNIMALALGDFLHAGDVRAAQLKQKILEAKEPFDTAVQAGLKLAFQDDRILGHYFSRPEQMAKAIVALSIPEAQIDFESFFSVAEDFTHQYFHGLLKEKALTCPTLVILGNSDPVIHVEKETSAARKLFSKVSFKTVKNTGHYAHLDDPQAFIQSLLEFLH